MPISMTYSRQTTGCQLYLITPPVVPSVAQFVRDLQAALAAGPVAALQIRLKTADGFAPDSDILALAAAVRPLLDDHDVALMINDRADLAHAAGADGVHLGQGDGSVAAARQLLGAEAQIGVTCHNSRHLAMEAGEAGADYVAFGAFYPTRTKSPPTMATPEILSWWSGIAELPCVAIGGITVDNAAPLVAAGADFIAVSAGVWEHADGPAAAVAAFAHILTAA